MNMDNEWSDRQLPKKAPDEFSILWGAVDAAEEALADALSAHPSVVSKVGDLLKVNEPNAWASIWYAATEEARRMLWQKAHPLQERIEADAKRIAELEADRKSVVLQVGEPEPGQSLGNLVFGMLKAAEKAGGMS